MRIAYKSIPIVQAYTSGRVVTTVFDMSQVKDHVLEVAWWKVAFYPRYFGVILLIWAVLALCLTYAKGYEISNPIVLGVVLTIAFAILWFFAYILAHGRLTEDHARQERGVPAKTQLKIVEEKEWPAFVEKLRRQNPGSG
jgi:hypothetical protein